MISLQGGEGGKGGGGGGGGERCRKQLECERELEREERGMGIGMEETSFTQNTRVFEETTSHGVRPGHWRSRNSLLLYTAQSPSLPTISGRIPNCAMFHRSNNDDELKPYIAKITHGIQVQRSRSLNYNQSSCLLANMCVEPQIKDTLGSQIIERSHLLRVSLINRWAAPVLMRRERTGCKPNPGFVP